ncbi:MAG: tetratricopeptide repeat protein, partial [Rhodospirillales bacterium]
MSAVVRLLVVATLLVAGVPAHADYAAGVAAYKHGDYTAAYEEWLPLATDGVAKAQFNIGILYYGGEGVSTDFYMAQLWFRKAAAQGHAEAQFNLAAMMDFGEG